MKKIISFDIWDTIIKRKCHPEEVKLWTAKYILLKYESKLKEKYKDIYNILSKRNEIEYEICQENKKNGYDEECRIEDVFRILQQNIFKDCISDISQELLMEELEQEKRVIYVNPDIISIFDKYKDLRIFCISDFYMGSKYLHELLEYLGISYKIEKIYSSADYLLNKKSGNLFKLAEHEIGVEPEEHIHVGDNIYSDIEIPKSLGIDTIQINRKEIEFSPKRNRGFCFDIEKVKKATNKKIDKLFNVGVDLASIIYFFEYSIIEYSIKNKLDKIYYCTREGETFIKFHELIKNDNCFGMQIPECETIEVSRMATFAPSLNEFSISELMRLWSQYRNQSMKALFKTLAINIELYKQYLGKYDLSVDEVIVEPWFDLRVQKLCKDKEFCDKINIEIKNKKNELEQYFSKNKGIVNEPGKILLVDIGWRGTIQDNLAYIFNNKTILGYYLTLYDFYNVQPENVQKFKYISDKNIINNEVATIITLLEWIYNPGTGSVIKYKDGEAIREAKTKEKKIVEEYIFPIQQGMYEGAKYINEYMKIHPYEACEKKEYVYGVLKNIKEKPNEELVEAYYSMVFNDTFGTGEYVKKEKKLSFIDKYNPIKCRNILRNELWKEAFMVHNNISYMNYILNIKNICRKILGRK